MGAWGDAPARMHDEPQGTMHGWIWRTNVPPFVETIADLVGFRFDREALLSGVDGSDAESERWFTFVLDGRPPVELRLSRADQQVLVDVELDGITESLEIRAALLLDLCNRYELIPRTD